MRKGAWSPDLSVDGLLMTHSGTWIQLNLKPALPHVSVLSCVSPGFSSISSILFYYQTLSICEMDPAFLQGKSLTLTYENL
jgi:hypothetical protein